LEGYFVKETVKRHENIIHEKNLVILEILTFKERGRERVKQMLQIINNNINKTKMHNSPVNIDPWKISSSKNCL